MSPLGPALPVTALSKSLPWRITLPYATGATLWILLSDTALSFAGWTPEDSWQVGTLKGLLFVGVTSALLYGVTRRLTRRQQEVEKAEHESRVRWEFALEAAGDGVWDWNIPSGDVFYSDRCWKMFGYEQGSLASRIEVWRERIHPADWPDVEQAMEVHFRGETAAWVSEHRVRTAREGYKWILTRGKVVARSAEGAPLRMLGVVSDVTQRRLVESRLEAALAFSHTVLQSSPVGLIACQPDGAVLSVNPAAARILGCAVEQLLGGNCHVLAPLRAAGFVIAAERALVEEREVVQVAELVGEGGRVRRVEMRLVPFRHQGEQRLLAVLQDETEMHEAMRELHLARAALQAAPTGWVITDAQGRIEWTNPAFTRLTGYTFEEVVGQNPRLLRSGRHPEAFYASMWATIQRGEVWDGEMQNRRKDGTLYHEHMVIAPVRAADGTIAHFVAMKEDITAERELEQHLARAQRLESIGLMASGIAHDLNNVLAPITLSMELLRAKLTDPSMLPALNIVAQSAQRGAGIVRQVLTFARGVEGERGEVSVRNLLQEVARFVEETFPRNIKVQVLVPREPGRVSGDLTQLHQVLLNLALNARDAMPEGGTLTLRAEPVEVGEAHVRRLPALKPGPHVLLSVTDTGSGIPPEALDRIFDPFFTTKPRGKGTGLGLSTVHGLVRSHGGAVEVTTEMDAGTTFTVYLPSLLAPAAVESRQSLSPFGGGAGRRVLVVDDEPAILDIVGVLLAQHGFEVRVARDGAEGLAVFESGGPWDLAIVDRMMPQLDGMALAAAMRLADARLPIVIMSGLMHEPVSSEGIGPTLAELGIEVVLEKPFGEADLVGALKRALPAAKR